MQMNKMDRVFRYLVVRFLNNIAITRFMARQRIPPPESPIYTSI